MEGKKARKPNFSVAECELILQLAEDNLAVIREKFSNISRIRKKMKFGSQSAIKLMLLGLQREVVKI